MKKEAQECPDLHAVGSQKGIALSGAVWARGKPSRAPLDHVSSLWLQSTISFSLFSLTLAFDRTLEVLGGLAQVTDRMDKVADKFLLRGELPIKCFCLLKLSFMLNES